jgi:hypothetical protein
MSQQPQPPQQQGPVYVGARHSSGQQSLADVLERVLDKGIVIVGDIQVRLLDIELLTIKIRLMVASVDRAREMGINWWEGDPFVSNLEDQDKVVMSEGRQAELEQRLQLLEQQLGQAQLAQAQLDQAQLDQAQQQDGGQEVRQQARQEDSDESGG